jgi:poly(3-hydroxybutyrate) depolymerase
MIARRWLGAFLALLLVTLGAPLCRAQPTTFPEGTGPGLFIWKDPAGGPADQMRVWVFRPPELAANSRILFVLHGVRRDARLYRDAWGDAGLEANALIVVPEFDPERFTDGPAYQQGGLFGADGIARPRAAWTFAILERLFDHVRRETRITTERYHLFGHSAGGQFVHRMVMFMPEARIQRAVASNAGWYTFPTFQQRFPYGLARGPAQPGDLAAMFGRPLVVMVGQEDTDTRHPTLRQGPEADAQGPHRLARGRAFMAAAEAEAKRLGAPLAWRKIEVPKVAHDFRAMARAAADVLFTDPKG